VIWSNPPRRLVSELTVFGDLEMNNDKYEVDWLAIVLVFVATALASLPMAVLLF